MVDLHSGYFIYHLFVLFQNLQFDNFLIKWRSNLDLFQAKIARRYILFLQSPSLFTSPMEPFVLTSKSQNVIIQFTLSHRPNSYLMEACRNMVFHITSVVVLSHQTTFITQDIVSPILRLWLVVYFHYSHLYYKFTSFITYFQSKENTVTFSKIYFGSLSC